ncbi:DNA replication licensing factor MCM7 [Thecaphora frezii]
MTTTGSILPTINLQINYQEERQKIANFLRFFKAVSGLDSSNPVHIEPNDDVHDTDADIKHTLAGSLQDMDADADRSGRCCSRTSRQVPIYMMQLQHIPNHEQDTLVIDLKDIANRTNTQTGESGKMLVSAIRNNAKRYIDLFCEYVDRERPNPDKDISHKDDVLGVIRHQRMERNARTVEGQQEMQDNEADVFPPVLLRRYTLYLKPVKQMEPLGLCEVLAFSVV